MADPTLDAYSARSRASPFTEHDHPSAWGDTVAASFALTRREEISSSAGNNWEKKVGDRAKVIKSLGGDEQLAIAYGHEPFAMAELRRLEAAGATGGQEWSALRSSLPFAAEAYDYVRSMEKLHPDQVLDDRALHEQMRQELAVERMRDQDVINRGPGSAAFVGSAGGAITDPLVIGTAPIGAGVGPGKTALQTIGKTALAEGGVAAATEIPIQVQVLQFKRDIESPWSAADSAVNVLAAGAGGFVFGGTIAGGAIGYRKALEKYREWKAKPGAKVTPEMEAAEDALEQAVVAHDQNPLQQPVGAEALAAEIHARALDTAQAQVDAGQPVNVGQVVGGFEKPDPVGEISTRAADPLALVDVDPLELHVDAKTFQFKGGGDAEGVTSTLRDVERFDRRLAGVALIWERADGRRFIADGHQRVALARRAIAAGQDAGEVRLNGFILREADGVSAVDARRMAAVKNMAEGSGSALDAAKILRDVGPAGEALLPPLPPRSALVKQARGLANLGDEEFLAVVNGAVDPNIGGLVGAATPDPKLQAAMIQVLKRAQPANEAQARSIIEQVKTQGVETRTTEDLFGEQSFTESLYLERAQVLDATLKLARVDRTVFGALVRNEERIAGAGTNRLDRAANVARQQEATDAAQQITVRANAKGPLSDALTEAARKVREGAKPGDVAKSFLQAARREIVQGNPGRSAPGGAGPRSDPARIAEVDLKGTIDTRDLPDLEKLSKDSADYIEATSSSVNVQVSDLLGTKAPDQRSSDNAVKRFAAAAAGEIPKRKPIKVQVSENGQLVVVDGNGTLQAMRRLGVSSVPVELEIPLGKPINMQAVAPHLQPLVHAAFIGKQAGQTLDELYQVAAKHQATLAKECQAIADELGGEVVFMDPGVKSRTGAEEKLGRKGYKGAGQIVDVIRMGFIARVPELSRQILERLARKFELDDQGVTFTGLGYMDHKALIRFPDGRVAELQIWDEPMLLAKEGPGHQLYEEMRVMSAEEAATPEGLAKREAITEASKDLYAKAIAAGSPEWRRVAMMGLSEDMRVRVQEALATGAGAGSAGKPGNMSKKAARESSEPDSKTSTGTTRAQASPPGSQTKASSPPSSADLTTAARPSQLKNLSAIDAPPRTIIHKVDDPQSAQPTASKTGTVEDADYDAVMSQYQDLLDEQGQLLRITREVDGITSDRAAAAVIDELDTLEESLERVRLCSLPPRAA